MVGTAEPGERSESINVAAEHIKAVVANWMKEKLHNRPDLLEAVSHEVSSALSEVIREKVGKLYPDTPHRQVQEGIEAILTVSDSLMKKAWDNYFEFIKQMIKVYAGMGMFGVFVAPSEPAGEAKGSGVAKKGDDAMAMAVSPEKTKLPHVLFLIVISLRRLSMHSWIKQASSLR